MDASTSRDEDGIQAAFDALVEDVAVSQTASQFLARKKPTNPRADQSAPQTDAACDVVIGAVRKVVKELAAARKRQRVVPEEAIDDLALSSQARFTDHLALANYAPFLQYVPRVVNVVTLAEAVPEQGSGIVLPLDLRTIASKCNGSYYAPRKFAAVQLAFTMPRSRVLVFHTGRIVGTGTGSAIASRVAIACAQRLLAEQAGVHLCIRNFSVINSVGAASLNAKLDCDAFATEHRDASHYDRASFVGMAWRPKDENICCEVYSTGRANLPGATTERDLQDSWRRMLPTLLKHSSASRMLARFPGEAQVPASEVTCAWHAWAEPTHASHDRVEDGHTDDEDYYEIDDEALGELGL